MRICRDFVGSSILHACTRALAAGFLWRLVLAVAVRRLCVDRTVPVAADLDLQNLHRTYVTRQEKRVQDVGKARYERIHGAQLLDSLPMPSYTRPRAPALGSMAMGVDEKTLVPRSASMEYLLSTSKEFDSCFCVNPSYLSAVQQPTNQAVVIAIAHARLANTRQRDEKGYTAVRAS